MAPAIPTERRIMNSNRTRPASPSRTVRPREEDRPSGRRDGRLDGAGDALAGRVAGAARASSSRKRLVISSE